MKNRVKASEMAKQAIPIEIMPNKFAFKRILSHLYAKMPVFTMKRHITAIMPLFIEGTLEKIAKNECNF